MKLKKKQVLLDQVISQDIRLTKKTEHHKPKNEKWKIFAKHQESFSDSSMQDDDFMLGQSATKIVFQRRSSF